MWSILLLKGDTFWNRSPIIGICPKNYRLYAVLATDYLNEDGFGMSPSLPIEVWTQLTLVLKQKTCSMYIDKNLTN